jgi:hypothetical protein
MTPVIVIVTGLCVVSIEIPVVLRREDLAFSGIWFGYILVVAPISDYLKMEPGHQFRLKAFYKVCLLVTSVFLSYIQYSS